jgi:hypothetical protein
MESLNYEVWDSIKTTMVDGLKEQSGQVHQQRWGQRRTVQSSKMIGSDSCRR